MVNMITISKKIEEPQLFFRLIGEFCICDKIYSGTHIYFLTSFTNV